MTVVVAWVAGCVLGAVAPWFVARGEVGRRARGMAGVGGSRPGGRGPGAGSTGGRPGALRRRRPGRAEEDRVELGVLLELLAAAVGAGASVPRALEAVGRALGGADGAALRRVAAAVVLGATWDGAWADAPARLDVVRTALRPAWVHGAAPGESLRAAAEQLRQERQATAKRAAARLAVHLVLPLGACFLPAFVLVGLLPLLISLGAGLLGR